MFGGSLRTLRLLVAGFVVLAVFSSAISLLSYHWDLLITYPLFVVLYVLLAGIVFGWFGGAFGLSNLFWHESARTQFGAGVSVIALMLIVNAVSYEILRDLDGDRRMMDMREYRDNLLWFINLHIEEEAHSERTRERFPVDLAEVDTAENGGPAGDHHEAGTVHHEAVGPEKETLNELIEEANDYVRYELAHHGRTHGDPTHEPEWRLRDPLRERLDIMLLDYWNRAENNLPTVYEPERRAGVVTVEYFRSRHPDAVLEGGIRALRNRTLIFLCGSMLPWVGLLALPYLLQQTFVLRLWYRLTNDWLGLNIRQLNLGARNGLPFVLGLLFALALTLCVAFWWFPPWTTRLYEWLVQNQQLPSTRDDLPRFLEWLPRWSYSWIRINIRLMFEIFILQFSFFLFLAGFVLLARRPWISKWVVTPPVALCLVFGLFAVGYGLFVHLAFIHPLAQFVAALTILVGLIHTNFSPYKLGFPVLEELLKPDKDVHLRGVSLKERSRAPQQESADGLLDSAVALDRWKAIAPKASNAQGAARPILAVVATSGGSIRSGVWTAQVLATLEQRIPGFPYHVRLMTGASGGMLGAGLYAATLQEPVPNRPDRPQRSREQIHEALVALPSDSLSDVARCLALYDLPRIIRRGPYTHDRGRALEQAWEASHPAFAMTFRELAEGERAGWRPSLLFSPMLVEDGRRLLISNLDLRHLTLNTGALLIDDKSALIQPDQKRFPSEDIYSQSAFELFQLFPEARDFRLSTAMRMSATFPFISPAVSLPTAPARRVVDAGYYDNYGINTAAMWLAHHRDWLAENTTGVVLIQVRAFDSPREVNLPEQATAPRGNGSWANAFKFVTSPIQGLLQARRAVMSYRNDEQLEWLSNWFGDRTGHPEFFQTITFENPASASLSWHITECERANILKSFTRDEKAAQENWARLAQLEGWWSRASSRAPQARSPA